MYRINEKSEAVREIQTYLRELSRRFDEIPVIHIDGIYGEETREAVRAFQKMAGIPETGDSDYETFTLLFRLYETVKNERIGESELIPAAAFPLRMGDSGSYVRILQSVLGEVLTLTLPADGFYGRTTEDAVRLAEGRYRVPLSGNVSRLLWQMLAADYRAAIAEKILT